MMDSRESDGGPRIAIQGGSVRRRPPMAPHAAAAAAAQSYGTNEDDSLLPSHNEEGYPVLQSYRRRSSGAYYPWYRQPHKLILGAALAWVGSVMYLASLAHSILRTQNKAFHSNIMGSSMVDYHYLDTKLIKPIKVQLWKKILRNPSGLGSYTNRI